MFIYNLQNYFQMVQGMLWNMSGWTVWDLQGKLKAK